MIRVGQPGWWSLRYGVTALWPCVRHGSEKGQWPLPGLWSFIWEEAVPWHLPWCQTLQFLPVCYRCPSSCCPGNRAQRERACLSPQSVACSLTGDSQESCSFSTAPTSTGFYSQKLWGLIFLALESWAGWSGMELGSFASELSLLILSTTCGCGTTHFASPHLCPSYPSGSMWLL